MENQLSVIVQESGLEQTKAQYILDNFESYFAIASEWEKKAKAIVVTDPSQRAEMKMAREARLFLRDKRLDVEKARKALKEQSLREGKAIDGIANVLKALIEPIEQYLDEQEHFVEIKAEEEAARLRAEENARIEAQRLADEKAREDERLRMFAENDRLKAEAEAREKAMQAEREKAEAERRALEDKARKEAEAREKLEAEKRQKIAEEKAQAAAERDAKKQNAYKAFLAEHGYTKETQDDYSVKVEGNHIVLFKKVGEITLE